MDLSSASVDQATTSIETLTSLVQKVLQNNRDLRARVGSLESPICDQTIRSATSKQQEDGEDIASTIRPRRYTSDPVIENSQIEHAAIKRFTFEQDLRDSKVYARARRRNSCESLQSSAAPSFGWSCLSEMSLANVSNVSVISLPIAVNELSNSGHYSRSPLALQELNTMKARRTGVIGAKPLIPYLKNSAEAGSDNIQEHSTSRLVCF